MTHTLKAGTRSRRAPMRTGAILAATAISAALALSACSSSSSGGSGTSAGPTSGVAAAAGGSSAAATVAPNPKHPTLLMDWFPNPDFTSLYMADESGAFQKAGLDGVTFQPPSTNQDALKLVSTGAMPIGISYEPDILESMAKGTDIVAVGALIPAPLDSLIISGKNDITSPAGLAGKKIGTDGDPVAIAVLDTILKKNGVDPSKTKQIAVNQGLVPAILTGNVDSIISGYRNIEAIQIKNKGNAAKVFPVTDEGVPNYDELVIVAQKSRLAKDPAYAQMVRDFLTGLAQGDAAAQADPAAAVPVVKSHLRASDGYTDADVKAMVPATTALLKNPGGFGHMDATQWQAFADWMLANKLIDKQVTATDAFTNDYLPKS